MLEANNDIDFTSNNEIPLEQVIAQMEKELAMSGEEHIFASKNPSSLIRELSTVLKKIDKGTRITNLFYRIDVNPIKANAELPYYDGLSALAWNRVFQKVWFRTNFKTGNK